MITSHKNETVRKLVALREKPRERKSQGVFITEGLKMLLEAPVESVREVYFSESFEKEHADTAVRYLNGNITGDVLSDDVFKKVSDTVTPQGVLCVIRKKDYCLNDMLPGTEDKNPFLLLLERTQDPGNLGTMIRTAEAMGVTGIIAGEGTADVTNPKVIRSTMGSIYRMPYLTTGDFGSIVTELKRRGILTLAAALDASDELTDTDLKGPVAFLIGNESSGLSNEAMRAAQKKIKIPMEGRTESLNAAVAAAVCMFETLRQRRSS